MPLSAPSPRIVTGILLAASSTSIGGATAVVTRYVIEQADPLTLAATRSVIGGATLAAIVFAVTRLPRIAPRDWLGMAVPGLLMFAVFPTLFARALEDTTAGRGGLMFATIPLMSVVLGSLLGVEKLTIRRMLAVLVAGAGTALALSERVGTAAPMAWRGDLIMFAAMCCPVVYNFAVRPYVFRYGGLPVTAILTLMGGATMTVALFAAGPPVGEALDFDLAGWACVIGLAIPGGAFMHLLWVWALPRALPSQLTITVGLNPIVAALLGAAVLAEPLSQRLFGGIALVVAGIVLTNLEIGRRRASPVRPGGA